jgi:hypothetical protein
MYKIIVTKKLRDYFSNKYSSMFTQPSLIRFMEYICFSNYRDEETGRLILCGKVLAEIEKKKYDTHYVGIEFLNKIEQNMPSFKVSNPVYKQGKARQLISALDQEDHDQILQNLIDKAAGEKKVYFRTGELANKPKIYEERKQVQKDHAQAIKDMDLLDDQRKIIEYMNSIEPVLFVKLINKNYEYAREVMHNLDYKTEHARMKTYQLFDIIKEHPKPLYNGSRTANTVRVHADGQSLVAIKKNVRKALCRGCIEADLKSSQFAILATKLDCQPALDFISSGESIWSELLAFAKGSQIDKEDKAELKKALYALAFGMKEHKILDILKPVGLEQVLNHEIMRDMLVKRDIWHDQIKNNGGCMDAYGQFHPWSYDERPSHKIAATVIQSIEFKIIQAVFDEAIKQGDNLRFKIIVWQHDGFTFTTEGKNNAKIMNVLQNAVKAQAEEFSVNTTLEFEEL